MTSGGVRTPGAEAWARLGARSGPEPDGSAPQAIRAARASDPPPTPDEAMRALAETELRRGRVAATVRWLRAIHPGPLDD